MRIFARINRHIVAQVVVLPSGLVPSDIYVPSIASTMAEATGRDPAPQIGWLFYQDGSFGPPAALEPDMPTSQARSRAKDLLYSCDPVIEHFYEHFAPVPEEWTAYRLALRQIVISGVVPVDGGPARPDFPVFSFRRDGRLAPPATLGAARAA